MKHFKFIVLLAVIGCSPKISEHFEQNRYIRNYNIHIINDSLEIYFKSPGDIEYITDKRQLKKVLRKVKFKLKDSVLVYGKTDDPPYEYFVTFSDKFNFIYPKKLIVFDTIIHNKAICFIGNPLVKNATQTLKIDLKNIFQSLEVGKGYRKDISSVMEVVNRYANSNKFYGALNEITKYPAYHKQEEWTKFQMEFTFSSFLGNNEHYKKSLNELESKFKPNDSITNIINKEVVINSEAIEKIVDEAKKYRIIMFNENHFFPNHRILISELLPKLKDIGYTYLALEALDIKQDSLLNLENAYPTLETGFYTSEQNYGNLIRKAKALGFQFVAYENMESNKDREIGQAENLYNKTFKINPNDKVVILAGIDHILEKPTSKGKKWMATIFKEKYNIDPLTISQTHLNSYRKQFQCDYCLIDSKYFDSERLSSVDFHLLNNKNVYQDNWDSTFSYQNSSNFDVQVSLFQENEIEKLYDYHKKVPYYTAILEKGKKYNLPINKGQKIYLYTFTKNGNRIDEKIITPVNN
ncbi:MAG: hypothetical protein Q8J84_06505 [Flavobacteriaceae bacterium]|nr:hypothetical protein [Flavobacteriaceae bacterium]